MKRTALPALALLCLLALVASGLSAFSGEAQALALNLLAQSESLSSTPDWVVDGQQNGGEFGYAVSGAGDVNHDGYADVIVGADKNEMTVYKEGTARVYLGGAGGLATSPQWIGGGGITGSRYGAAVAGGGNVNGDLYDDVLVGAPRFNPTQAGEGGVFLYYGSWSGIRSTDMVTLTLGIKEAEFGYSVAFAGDVDNDGYDDVLVGARTYSSGEANEGAVLLYYGSSSGLVSDSPWIFESGMPGAMLGSAVGSAGDVNGDGYADFWAGAPFYNKPLNLAGAVYLFLGSQDGPAAAPDWMATGVQGDEWFGWAGACAGDVNSDGYSDLLIGAPEYDNLQLEDEGDDAGRVVLYLGSYSGLRSSPSWQIVGVQGGTRFGAALAGAGDVDADGFDDVLIGASLYDHDQPDEGIAWLFRGVTSGLRYQPSWQATGDKAEAWLGFSLSGAGDVDGDELDDVIIGAPNYRLATDPVGRVYVYHGQVVDSYSLFLPAVIQR